MNAVVTVEAFAWLVGPCEVVPREGDGELAAVKLRKCRYLEQCGCTSSCVNFCKRPTEAFFREAFGVDAHLAPNHEDGSCVMTFGVAAPAPDPAFDQPCYASCAKSATCAVGAAASVNAHTAAGPGAAGGPAGLAGTGEGAGGGRDGEEKEKPRPCHRLGEP